MRQCIKTQCSGSVLASFWEGGVVQEGGISDRDYWRSLAGVPLHLRIDK